MIHWLPYCVLVAGMLALAALALEALLMLYRRPLRWVWVGSLAASLGLPALAWLAPAAVPLSGGPGVGAGSGSLFGEVAVLVAAPVLAGGAGPGALAGAAPGWQPFLPWVWLAGSALVAVFLVVSSIRLARLRRGWRRRELDGEPVLVSERTGPAVVGLLRGRIVVPAWVLGLTAEERCLVLAHEREHLRAGDHRLLLLGLLALAAMPWNPLVWWQVRRLRGALELDCDARVLRRHPDLRGYGDLLLEMTQRNGAGTLLAPAIAEPRNLIKRRIRAMTTIVPRHRTCRALGLAAFTGALVAVACEAPAPAPRDAMVGIAPAAGQQPAVAQAPQHPAATPEPAPAGVLDPPGDRTQQPRPPVPIGLVLSPLPLTSADLPVIPFHVRVYVDEQGRVVPDSTRLDPETGDSVFDAFVISAAERWSFEPARLGTRTVGSWFSYTMTRPGTTSPPTATPPPPPDTVTQLQIRGGATGQTMLFVDGVGPDTVAATPPTPPDTVTQLQIRGGATGQTMLFVERVRSDTGAVPPRWINQEEIVALYSREYPAALRERGLRDPVRVWHLVDAEGKVQDVRLNQSSGDEELDRIALRIAWQVRFAPAQNRGRNLAVWVLLPHRF